MDNSLTPQARLEEVLSYIEDNSDVDITNSVLDLQELADAHGITLEEAHILCCNLEDTETMQEIIDGDYTSTFDPWDASIFNDGYGGIMEELGLIDWEDEWNDESGD